MLANLRSQGAQYGLEFGDIELMANTHKALLVSEYAKTVGKGHIFADAMLKAYFKDAQNIGVDEVIVSIAESVGIEKQGVMEAIQNSDFEKVLSENLETGHQLNIRSVPTFIINDKQMVVGAQSVETFRNLFNSMMTGSSVIL